MRASRADATTAARVEGARICIPVLGWVRLHEALRFNGKIMNATASRVADCWYVSVTAEPPEKSALSPAENQGAV